MEQFLKFFIVGVSSTVLDILLLITFKELIGLHPAGAVALNQIIIISFNFLLNKYWSFNSKEKTHRQIVRYLTLFMCNYFCAIGIMYLFYEVIGIHYIIVRLGTIALFMLTNFLAYKHWVYKI
jgi:putative flippase GtrA